MAKKLKDFKPKMCSDCGKTPCACMSEARLDEGRPSQRHPLEGHEYHKKSDAALIHIAKDAHAAAEAMKSHNTTAENKYRDQANDSATVRHFRKTNGMPTWYKKKYGHSTNEEVEQVDEKASDKEVKMATGIPHDKRYVGGNMTGAISAIEKIRPDLSKHPRVAASLKAANEEVEQVDELDRSGTLTRYIDKTRGDPERKAGNALALKKKWGDKNYGLEEPKVKGMDRNEEVERINEKLETETIKHPKGERPKGIGWVLKSAGEQTGKDHSVWERKFKRVGGVKEEVQAVDEEIKPYVSKLKQDWQVLDHEGKVKFSSKDHDTATSHWKKNYEKYRDPKYTKEENEVVDEAVSKKKRVMSFMSHDPEAGQRILAMGKKEREEKKAFKSGQSEINRLKRMGEEVEMFEAVDPVEARDILKKHGGADEDFHALPSEHKNSLHHLAYKFKHNPGKSASGSRARMFHAHLKRQAAKADKAQADVQKLTKEEHDYEYEMARNQLTTASRSIERLMGMLKGEGNLEAWVQSKLTMAADYLDTVADYMESDKKN